MRTTQIINYKGFELKVRVEHGLEILSIYSSDLTNQLALLTQALTDGIEIVKDYSIELKYKVILDGDLEIDSAIDVDKWLNTDLSTKESILIALLNEEIEDIEEVYNYNY